jgi:hypothetical protein
VGQQMPKREKGKGEARWQAKTVCILSTVCGSPVFAVSPFAFWDRKAKKGRYQTSVTTKCFETLFPFSLFAFWVLGSCWVASLAEVVAVLAGTCVLWDRKRQKGKREKGREGHLHSTSWLSTSSEDASGHRGCSVKDILCLPMLLLVCHRLATVASTAAMEHGYWVRLVAVQCLQCRLSPFGVVRQKRGDVMPLTPRSALKPFSPYPFSPFGF